jgi:hypothetical protein
MSELQSWVNAAAVLGAGVIALIMAVYVLVFVLLYAAALVFLTVEYSVIFLAFAARRCGLNWEV